VALTGVGQTGLIARAPEHDINYMDARGRPRGLGTAERPVAAYRRPADHASALQEALAAVGGAVPEARERTRAFIEATRGASAETVLAWQAIR